MSEAPPTIFGHEREAAVVCYRDMMSDGVLASGEYQDPMLAVGSFVSRWLTDTYGPTGHENARFRYGRVLYHVKRILGGYE